MTKVRVRFAPSPTGFLHIGGMRSALFNWLFAKHHQGSFILRLEDTDRERFLPEAVEQIKASHDWLGLKPDETHVQSERLAFYKQAANELTEAGHLYPCWCSPMRLEQLRDKAKAEKRPYKYDRHCLTHPGKPDAPHVLRFKIPDHPKQIGWDDAVRGRMNFELDDLDDFVAIKSDGFPTYNFANVVDDHAMEISHVLRAEEFLSSTPKHLLIYQAFGWQPPIFGHLPQVLSSDGHSKLSKRQGTKSILEYRDEGYLPDAIINFMALLGWNEGEGTTKEIYTRQELTKAFSLERIQKSPAVFDPDRLDWLNGLYIRQLDAKDLAEAARDFWPTGAEAGEDYKLKVLGLVQERLKKMSELAELTEFFFIEPKIKIDATPSTKDWLQASLKLIEDTDFKAPALEASFRDLATKLNAKPKDFFGLLRLVITGQTASPPLFETMEVLGLQQVTKRLQAAISA